MWVDLRTVWNLSGRGNQNNWAKIAKEKDTRAVYETLRYTLATGDVA